MDEMSADAGAGESDALFIGQVLDPASEDEEDDDMESIQLPSGKADDGRSPEGEEEEAASDDFSRSGELSGGAVMGCDVTSGAVDWPILLLLLAYAPSRRRR